LYCLEHWSAARERARKAEQDRAPVIVGGRLSDAQLLTLAAVQQMRAAG
jgi:hypothetical protein